MISVAILAFCSTFATAAIIWGLSGTLLKVMPNYTNYERALHNANTLRFGGLSIIIGLLGLIIAEKLGIIALETKIIQSIFIALVLFLPLLCIAILEDLHIPTRPRFRLLISFLSAILLSTVLSTAYFQHWIFSVPLVGTIVLAWYFTYTIHAYNLIDGANGLALSTYCAQLLTIVIITALTHDTSIQNTAIIMLTTALGLLIWNYPFGKVFLGDAGAYYLGFSSGAISTVFALRNNETVSVFIILSISIYPLVEVSFSIIRRLIHRQPIFVADQKHLHHLLYQWLENRRSFPINMKAINNQIAPIMLLMQLPAFILSVLYRNNGLALVIVCALYSLIYISLYSWVSKQLPLPRNALIGTK